MAEGYLAINIIFLQERVRRIERRLKRRILRDAQNPFELPNNEFIAQFRVNKEVVRDIANVLRPHLQKQRITGLSPEIQILVTLSFFANGSYQRPVGNQCELVVSQPCASRCIRKVTRLMNVYLLRQWVRFPMTANERTIARNRFALAPQSFPGAIGAIDCTYINILAPHVHEEAYVNHHGNHSLNVQAVSFITMKLLHFILYVI